MNFQVLVLAFAVVIATNIHCQAQPELEGPDKFAEVTVHDLPRKCNCRGRGIALDQNCLCEVPRKNRLTTEQRRLCQKKGIRIIKKCQQLNKKSTKSISMPI